MTSNANIKKTETAALQSNQKKRSYRCKLNFSLDFSSPVENSFRTKEKDDFSSVNSPISSKATTLTQISSLNYDLFSDFIDEVWRNLPFLPSRPCQFSCNQSRQRLMYLANLSILPGDAFLLTALSLNQDLFASSCVKFWKNRPFEVQLKRLFSGAFYLNYSEDGI